MHLQPQTLSSNNSNINLRTIYICLSFFTHPENMSSISNLLYLVKLHQVQYLQPHRAARCHVVVLDNGGSCRSRVTHHKKKRHTRRQKASKCKQLKNQSLGFRQANSSIENSLKKRNTQKVGINGMQQSTAHGIWTVLLEITNELSNAWSQWFQWAHPVWSPHERNLICNNTVIITFLQHKVLINIIL